MSMMGSIQGPGARDRISGSRPLTAFVAVLCFSTRAATAAGAAQAVVH
jgi:hypothetical protein